MPRNLPVKSHTVNNTSIREISQVSYAFDNTSKTRALFEINKGANFFGNIDVNSQISYSYRRVPFENMIYIADGPSDVPVFSILKQNQGRTYAVYPKGNRKAFLQVNQLMKDNRINMYGEADYSEDTATYMWLMEHVGQIAESIYTKKQELISKSVSRPPMHLQD